MERHYDMLLLSVVTLISASFLGIISLFEPSAPIAKPVATDNGNVPVRVIVPFVPNTNPRER
jgi:hypothetical protein